MWALRRASIIPLKNRDFSTRVSVALSANSEQPSSYSEGSDGNCESAKRNLDTFLHSKRFYFTNKFPSKFSMGRRGLSSEAGAKSSGEDDDSEEGFSELETSTSDDDASVDQNDDPVNDDDNYVEEPTQNKLHLDTETDASEKELPKKRINYGLCKAIMAAPALSVQSVIDKWVEEGNELERPEYAHAMWYLRKHRVYGKALQLSEWIEKNKNTDRVERHYASRLDLIAKVHGLLKAEQYIENIPESFRGEKVYRTLLDNAVTSNNPSKAEEIFNKIKDLHFPLTTSDCNQLLILYKRHHKRIADILLLMEKENLRPDLLTFKILIDITGKSNDIAGMDRIIETMKEEGIKPDIKLQATIARYYIYAEEKEKAETLLKKIEGDNTINKLLSSWFLLHLYAALGKADEVQRLWKLCESNPGSYLSVAAIEAWGKLNRVEEAEAVFNKIVEAKKARSKHYSALLKIYANNKMLAKGEELVKQMSDSGCSIGPLTWDALVKLHIEAGEVEKADTILQKAVEKSSMEPMFNTYMMIMEEYAKRGDIHNTEKIFYKMKQHRGCYSHARQFQALITAYTNAKAPLYGIRERMKADNMYPNRAMAEQLAQVDAFRKTTDVSELLD